MNIRNIIATTDLQCQINLRDIALKVPDAKYNPDRFPALTLRIKEPKATAQVFKTGKIVCLGTKSLADLERAGSEFARYLTLLGCNATFTNFVIKNMVASCDVGFKIQLEQFADNHGGIYAPELFPALDYKLNHVTFLIFHSGKVIITGTKSQQEVDKAFNIVYPILQKYMK